MQVSEILNEVGEFNWAWTHEFFIETQKGNIIWSNPIYNGDNSFVVFNGSLDDFIKSRQITYVRYKGKHLIGTYTGNFKE